MRFSRNAGVWIHCEDWDYDNWEFKRCISNECGICHFRKEQIVNYKTKENKIMLESFNSGIAYNVDDKNHH